jgi:phosphate ABC transporter substrate-binding protein
MSKKIIWVVMTVLAALLAVWVWTFASIGNMPIVIGGSTSANSFMQSVTTKITSEDYSYNSTGSQNGMNGVLTGVYKVGVLSKNPTFENTNDWSTFGHNDEEQNKFVADKIDEHNFKDYVASKNKSPEKFSATQFAVDSIVIIYNPPGNISEMKEINFDIPKKNNFENENEKIISEIYKGKITDWSKVDPSLSGKIHAFTRETGSGTKTEFEKLTGTSDSSLANVANSNGMMYNSILKTDGSIGFVSLPFVHQIEKSSELFVAGVNDIRIGYKKDEDEHKIYKLENNSWTQQKETNENAIANGTYKLFRPFVFIFKNSNFNLFKTLFDFILKDERADDIYNKEGLIKGLVDIDPRPKEEVSVC